MTQLQMNKFVLRALSTWSDSCSCVLQLEES